MKNKLFILIFIVCANSLFASAIELTAKEKEYLKNNAITYAGDPNWLPFEAFDENGNYTGIIAEHIEIVEKKLNKKFDKIITKDWLDTLALSKKRGVDIISGDAADVILSQNYKAIDTYIKNPLVIVTRKEHQYVDNLHSLKDKKIAFTNGYGYSADILKKYPDMKFIECDTAQSGLLGVKTGQYDAFIGTLSMSDYTIIKMGREDIKIAGQIGIVMNLTLFVDKDKPLLYSIINKAIKTISKEKQHEIISKWRAIKIKKVIDYTLVWQISTVFFIFFSIGLLAYVRERKLNKIIKEEKDKFQNIFNKASDGISILRDGIFTDCNDSWVKLLGYTNKDQVLNLTPSQLSPEYQPDGKKSLDKSIEMMKIAKEDGINHFEWRHVRADAEAFWVDIVLTDISTKDGETIIHVVWRDIQHRKELEEKLFNLNTSLEKKVKEEVERNKEQQLIMLEQSRYAQMGEMISMIAHQWRQPLNVLSVISQTLVLKYMKGTIDKKAMDTFNTNSQKQIVAMSATIDDFRDFFKPEKEKKTFDIRKSIDHSIKILSPLLENGNIKLNVSIPENGDIYGFSNELGQSIINIINNAKDALMENNIEEKHIDIGLVKNDTQIILTISDNAGGIPEDIIGTIFDPYFSTKEKNGTGLGLYMSKLIIEEHMNGKITVENINEGAQFNIIFDKV